MTSLFGTYGPRANAAVRRVLLPGVVLFLLAAAPAASNGGQSRIDELYKQVAPLEELIGLVAAKVGPSVVHVTTELKDGTSFAPDSPSERRFGERFPRFFGSPEFVPHRALGAGVIVDERGLVLTNHHVVKGANSIAVRLAGGRQFEATVLGSDEGSDLAVLQFKPVDVKLRAATLGDSATVKVGQLVLAIGSPFALDDTVTVGVISATARAGVGVASYEDFLQTDAAINPGNSGGPLVNLRGQVIGINTAIATGSGSSAGVGFAIPSTMASRIMRDLIDKGRVVRGWLGLRISSVPRGLAKRLGLRSAEGALVTEVYPGMPAAQAGMRRGDVIVEFDGKKIRNHSELMNAVADTRVGRQAQLEVVRDRKPLRLTVTVAERTRQALAKAKMPEGIARGLGMTVQTLRRDLAARLGYKGKRGVVVTLVDPGSPADAKGVRRDDLILEVNKQKVESADDFAQRLAEVAADSNVLLRILKPSGEAVDVAIPQQ